MAVPTTRCTSTPAWPVRRSGADRQPQNRHQRRQTPGDQQLVRRPDEGPASGEYVVRAPIEPDTCIDDSAVLRRALGETPS